MDEYLNLWKNYANFSYRTTLRGYWMAFLFHCIAAFAISIISLFMLSPILSFVYGLAIFIPSLAITVRRLRDTGKEWVWILVSFIPVIGCIWLIILLCQPSVAPDNTPIV